MILGAVLDVLILWLLLSHSLVPCSLCQHLDVV